MPSFFANTSAGGGGGGGAGGKKGTRIVTYDSDDSDNQQQEGYDGDSCFFWGIGNCKRGDACPFSHDKPRGHARHHYNAPNNNKQQQKQQQKPKTAAAPNCFFWAKGQCTAGDTCRFHHDPQLYGIAKVQENKVQGAGGGGGSSSSLNPGYVCRRCGIPGHHIQNCPTNGDPAYDPADVKMKKKAAEEKKKAAKQKHSVKFNSQQAKIQEADALNREKDGDKKVASASPWDEAQYKTAMCVHYMRNGGEKNGGWCLYGSKCCFAHGVLDMRCVWDALEDVNGNIIKWRHKASGKVVDEMPDAWLKWKEMQDEARGKKTLAAEKKASAKKVALKNMPTLEAKKVTHLHQSRFDGFGSPIDGNGGGGSPISFAAATSNNNNNNNNNNNSSSSTSSSSSSNNSSSTIIASGTPWSRVVRAAPQTEAATQSNNDVRESAWNADSRRRARARAVIKDSLSRAMKKEMVDLFPDADETHFNHAHALAVDATMGLNVVCEILDELSTKKTIEIDDVIASVLTDAAICMLQQGGEQIEAVVSGRWNGGGGGEHVNDSSIDNNSGRSGYVRDFVEGGLHHLTDDEEEDNHHHHQSAPLEEGDNGSSNMARMAHDEQLVPSGECQLVSSPHRNWWPTDTKWKKDCGVPSAAAINQQQQQQPHNNMSTQTDVNNDADDGFGEGDAEKQHNNDILKTQLWQVALSELLKGVHELYPSMSMDTKQSIITQVVYHTRAQARFTTLLEVLTSESDKPSPGRLPDLEALVGEAQAWCALRLELHNIFASTAQALAEDDEFNDLALEAAAQVASWEDDYFDAAG